MIGHDYDNQSNYLNFKSEAYYLKLMDSNYPIKFMDFLVGNTNVILKLLVTGEDFCVGIICSVV